MSLVAFLASTPGRFVRATLGVVLIVVGALIGSVAGVVLIVVGALPLASGLFNFCLLRGLVARS